MLKVHPQYKIYGIGFANTIKDIVKEGFIYDYETSYLHIAHEMQDDVDSLGKPLYLTETKPGEEKLVPYGILYRNYLYRSHNFLVTVCEWAGDTLEPVGFIYM